jgi:hypothetical protein
MTDLADNAARRRIVTEFGTSFLGNTTSETIVILSSFNRVC